MALARIACRSAAVCALPTSIGSRRTKMLDIVFTGPDASFTRVPDRLVVLDAGGGLGEKELKGVCHKNSLNACASSGTRAAPSSIELTCHCACTYPSISGPPRQWAMRPLHVHTRPVAFESYQCDVEATLFGWMQHHQRNALKLMASAPVWPLHTQWPSAHRSGHCTHTHTLVKFSRSGSLLSSQPWCGLLETWPRPGTFLTSRRRHRCRHSLEDCPRATSTSAARLDFFPSLCA
jgi:hypothetical protein